MITHILKTRIDKRKMEAFMQIKTPSARRFSRSNSKRPKSNLDRKNV